MNIPQGVTNTPLWQRFLRYNRHVQRLEVVQDTLRPVQFTDVHHLVGAAPLFPNLRELTFTSHSDHGSPVGLYAVWGLFLGSHTRSIQVNGSGEGRWLYSADSPMAHFLSADVAHQGALTRLDVFLQADAAAFEQALLVALPAIRNVEELGMSCGVLTSPVLAALGTLARLRSLTLMDHPGSQNELAGLHAPLGSFPSLRALAVREIGGARLVNLLSTAALVKETTTFELKLASAPDVGTNDPVAAVFRHLSRDAPRLACLRLSVPPSSDGTTHEMASVHVSPLYWVRLVELSVSGVRLSDFDNCSVFIRGERWMTLRRFSWPDQRATSEDLFNFSRRYDLEVLGVSLRELEVPATPPAGSVVVPTSQQRLRLESDFALGHLTVTEVDRLVQ